MRISFDVDGVLADFVGSAVKQARTLFGESIVAADAVPTRWDFADILTYEQWKRIWQELTNTENLWEKVEPFKANVSALEVFIAEHPEVEIFYITARAKTPGRHPFFQTQKWLNKLGIRCGENIVVTNSSEKAVWMANLGIDFSIDDLAPTVRACNGMQFSRHKAFLLDRPYNALETDLPRVLDVAEFLEIVKHEQRRRQTVLHVSNRHSG